MALFPAATFRCLLRLKQLSIELRCGFKRKSDGLEHRRGVTFLSH
jgi:hypothetical protein